MTVPPQKHNNTKTAATMLPTTTLLLALDLRSFSIVRVGVGLLLALELRSFSIVRVGVGVGMLEEVI